MKRKILPLILLASTFHLLTASGADAANFWLCGSGSWGNDSCWSGGQPVDGQDVQVRQSGIGTLDTVVTYDSPSGVSLNNLGIHGNNVTEAALTIASPSSSINVNYLQVGHYGTAGSPAAYIGYGAVNQDSGAVSVFHNLEVGYGSYTGTYNLNGGELHSNAEQIGLHGPGVFNHNGASGSNPVNRIDTSLELGVFAADNFGNATPGSGTYVLGAGGLIANLEIIGAGGTGVFQQSAQNNYNNTPFLSVGDQAGASGSYTQMGGLLASESEHIGYFGNGSFTQWGGTNSTGFLTLGTFESGKGEYTMQGLFGSNPELNAADERIGSSGAGVFTQSGGTNTVANNLVLGHGSGSGKYTIDGSTPASLAATNEYIGWSGSTATSEFIQYNGTNSVSGGLYIGYEHGSSGTYALNGGILTAASEKTGVSGGGVFDQTGGMNFVSGGLEVGASTGTGTYNLSGGTLNASSEAVGTVAGIGAGTGAFNQTGGTNNVSGALTIGATGTYSLASGADPWLPVSLIAGSIVNYGELNYSGGDISSFGNVCTYCGADPNATPPGITNNGRFNISGAGTRTVNGPVTNNGMVKTTGTTVVYNGAFTNNGAYISDPSSNYFSDLVIGSNGYLVGGPGDNWFLTGNFMNYSEQSASWDTAGAYLGFTGFNPHEFHLAGWDATSSRSFSWGTLELNDGGSIFFSGGQGASLYVGNLILSAGSSMDLNGFNIYYYSLSDFGGVVRGGELINLASAGGPSQVPEPSTLVLIGGGLAGLIGLRRSFKRMGL